jgi:hypothetical protein
MNIRAEILKEHSKKQTLKVANYIGADKKLLAEAMTLFFANEYRVTQRMAAVINVCFEKHPDLLKPYFKAMITNLENRNLHDAVKRNTVRILQFVDIPKELQGVAFENCMNLLLEPEEPIAVKAFSMTVLANLCKIEPDLKNELKIAIETQLPFGSAGFKNRGEKTLKLLGKLK